MHKGGGKRKGGNGGGKKKKLSSKQIKTEFRIMTRHIMASTSNFDDLQDRLLDLMDFVDTLSKSQKKEYKINFRPQIFSEIFEEIFAEKTQKSEILKFADTASQFVEAAGIHDINPVPCIGLFFTLNNAKKSLLREEELRAPENSEKAKNSLSREAFTSELRRVGLEMWHEVHNNLMSNFATAFSLTDLTEEEKRPIAKKAHKYLKNQMYKQAGNLILTFNLTNDFDIKFVAETLCRRDFAELGIKLAEMTQNKDLLKSIVKKLNAFKYGKLASSIINKYEFDQNEFPALLNHQRFGYLRSFVKRHNWMKAEEMALQAGKGAVNVLVKVLIKNKQFSEALSICQRHSELVEDYLVQEIGRKCKHPKFVQNELRRKDYFGPTEVSLLGEDEGAFLVLGDFGFDESNVLFVDDDQSDGFKEMTEAFLAAKTVGCDSEFGGSMTRFDKTIVATLQLGNGTHCAVFDCIALKASQPFKDFMLKFFADNNIEKVGHTFSSDVKALNNTFGISLEFNNIINIERSFMKGKQTQGLAKIVEQEYGKKFSKYNQESGWLQRPLRQGQLHYAALDAVSVWDILRRVRERGGEQAEQVYGQDYVEMKDEADFGKRSKKEVTQNDDALEKYIAEKNYKFLVDGMLLKLAFQLRNIGLDAEFAGEKNTPKETIAQAEAENRIILTRNRNLMLTKKTCPLIKVVSNKTQEQLKQVITRLKIQIDNKKVLSRCVKCNWHKLIPITFEEAQKTLKWENPKTREDCQFFKCERCGHIYWEGNMFKRAKENFASLKLWNEGMLEGKGSSAEGVERALETKEIAEKLQKASEGQNGQNQGLGKEEILEGGLGGEPANNGLNDAQGANGEPEKARVSLGMLSEEDRAKLKQELKEEILGELRAELRAMVEAVGVGSPGPEGN